MNGTKVSSSISKELSREKWEAKIGLWECACQWFHRKRKKKKKQQEMIPAKFGVCGQFRLFSCIWSRYMECNLTKSLENNKYFKMLQQNEVKIYHQLVRDKWWKSVFIDKKHKMPSLTLCAYILLTDLIKSAAFVRWRSCVNVSKIYSHFEI